MASSRAMNGGDGTFSYSKNSTWQKNVANFAMDLIREMVIDNLDVKELLSGSGSGSSAFVITDLGCSTGPNTFHAVQTLIDSVHKKYDQESGDDTGKRKLEFQVLFNDQTDNDFNTLFASLPQPRNYLAAGVPGSFHGRLFPSSSVHLAYAANSIQWLSKVPEAVLARESPAWNGGKIHCTGAPDAVVRAYEDQLEQDMDVFFRARGEEIANGGMMVIFSACTSRKGVQHQVTVTFTLVEAVLLEMVKEGALEQEKVDSFNLPVMIPCIEDMESAVERNGCFEMVTMELVDDACAVDHEVAVAAMHIRAGFEGILSHHFGKEIVDQLFMRAAQKKDYLAQLLTSSQSGNAHLLYAVLKRKNL